MKNLLELKKQMKKKRPEFIREVAHKIKRIRRSGWRRPVGMHSKMRECRGGRRKSVGKGYICPRLVRGLHFSGLEPVVIYSVDAIKKLDKSSQGAIIGKVGMKNKASILYKAKEIGITLLNVKNIDAALKEIGDKLQKRKDEKIRKEKKKSEQVKEKEKKAKETKPKLDEKVETEEEKATQKGKEKKELDRLLTRQEK